MIGGRNKEGYCDSTACIAIGRVSREERKEKYMAKKRSCRRTQDEDKIHDKAVKMRKMTDEQLVHYVEDRVAKAKSEGINFGKNSALCSKPNIDIDGIVTEIGSVKGIGATKLEVIRAILEKRIGGSNG